MRISIEEVRRIAALAQLHLDRAAEERLCEDLEQILAHIDMLCEVDTSAVVSALGVTEEGRGLRGDVPGATLSVEEALANAPLSGQSHFKVPRVIPG